MINTNYYRPIKIVLIQNKSIFNYKKHNKKYKIKTIFVNFNNKCKIQFNKISIPPKKISMLIIVMFV